ncbi:MULTISPECIES: glycosyltransferase [unclassified Actinomyces]|uniref:glycosyltransferase n=1 Tax=unclassified Actinomyces TaxID=2609248 RepID=UPI0013743FEE|nr:MULTISPECIES: glycosyltransferase [unclassified Actinomyces]MBW3069347.1 glycosyltransferase [Actinomyces sp. 594]NDR53774.1 glycosyltransferase [Actinomyces sp. 565]QHO91316.1 glycosyl transferase family 1 [Actinomyces sp. 432]
MKRLVILANAFPFGNWEPFLTTELEYVTGFDRVDIMSLSVRADQRATVRPLPEGMHAHPIPFRSRLFYLLGSLRVLGDANLYRELADLARRRRLAPAQVVTLFIFLSRARHEAGQIDRILDSVGAAADDEVVFYSYRFAYQPYMAARLRRRFRRSVSVARAHRADLYEEHSPRGYLPLREQTVAGLDRIYLVADHGLRYLLGRHPQAAGKAVVSRLGTTDHGVPAAVPRRADGLRIVSCSTIVPVKRLDLLVDALAGSSRPIQWDHFGEGELREQIEARAAQKLGDNVTLTWRGFVRNADLVEEYVRAPRHLLVNVSASEGVPVSIMEALSAGIPVVATDVGGTGELVRTGVNGILLPADPTPEQVRSAVEEIAGLDEDAYAELRTGARRTWEERCDAGTLYTAFANELAGLLGAAPAGPVKPRGLGQGRA